jgi:hypothetical protein
LAYGSVHEESLKGELERADGGKNKPARMLLKLPKMAHIFEAFTELVKFR